MISLQVDFKSALEEAIRVHGLDKIQEDEKKLRKSLIILRGLIFQENIAPFEYLGITRQYESQIHILRNAGILEYLSNHKEGIIGIDGKEYPVPTLYEIAKRLKEKREIIKTKHEQGFKKLLIVPFGMSLDKLIDQYGQILVKHFKENKLLATKEKPEDPDEHLELGVRRPMFGLGRYWNADQSGNLVYYPSSFTSVHEGQTKWQILEQEKQGFHVLLVEDLPNLPGPGKGKKVGGRRQLEAGLAPEEYLQKIQESGKRKNRHYAHESGLTPEDQIVYSLTHLKETHQVIDDYEGRGRISFLIGAYFPGSASIPYFCWERDYHAASLDKESWGTRSEGFGCRTSVRV